MYDSWVTHVHQGLCVNRQTCDVRSLLPPPRGSTTTLARLEQVSFPPSHLTKPQFKMFKVTLDIYSLVNSFLNHPPSR